MFESSITGHAGHEHHRSGPLSAALVMHLLALVPIGVVSYLVVEEVTLPKNPGEIPIFRVNIADLVSTRSVDTAGATRPTRPPAPRLGNELGGTPKPSPSRPAAPAITPADFESPLEPDSLEPLGSGTSEGPGVVDQPYGTPVGTPDGFGADVRGVDPDGTGMDPIAILGNVIPPKLLKKVNPDYPQTARAAKIAGKVVVEAVVSPTGDVVNVKILSSASVLLNEAALEAIRQWKYQPATKNGKPVAVYFTVFVTFTLQ